MLLLIGGCIDDLLFLRGNGLGVAMGLALLGMIGDGSLSTAVDRRGRIMTAMYVLADRRVLWLLHGTF